MVRIDLLFFFQGGRVDLKVGFATSLIGVFSRAILVCPPPVFFCVMKLVEAAAVGVGSRGVRGFSG